MFQALYFAVACGIVAVEHSKNDRKENLVPLEGERVTTRTIAVVQENSLSWEKHKCRATYQLKRAWRTNLKVYLHCVLGQGCSGKVYLGSDSAGRMFAVKLYLFDAAILESFRAIDNEKTKMTQKQRAARVRDSEAEKWKNFYPSYKEAIYQGELFGVPCLAMPYVASIPMNRRKALLPKIEKELKRLSNKGFAYADHDLRWRHIGLRKDHDDGDDKIVLVDLESMKPRRKDDEAHTDHVYLQSAIKELRDRAEEERVRSPQELIHA